MFENYHIALTTRTVNFLTDADQGTLEYESTHANEGIVAIHVFTDDTRVLIASEEFTKPLQEEDAYRWIEKVVANYETAPHTEELLQQYNVQIASRTMQDVVALSKCLVDSVDSGSRQ